MIGNFASGFCNFLKLCEFRLELRVKVCHPAKQLHRTFEIARTSGSSPLSGRNSRRDCDDWHVRRGISVLNGHASLRGAKVAYLTSTPTKKRELSISLVYEAWTAARI
jgi:hypothetical protein